MEDLYELIIVGAGPAGLAAGVYAARAELNFTIIESGGVSGGQILQTTEIDNYPGKPSTSGHELAADLRAHCVSLGASFTEGEVKSVSKGDDGIFTINLYGNRTLRAKAVIAATGASHKALGVPGEEELTGSGVSYCATCDGAFFKGRNVAVIGGGDVAFEDALYLSRICSSVTLIHRRSSYRAAAALVSALKKQPNVRFITDTVAEYICGEDFVTGLKLRNTIDNSTSILDVDGVFIAVGISPESGIWAGLADRDEAGYIRADESCVTSVPGLFAAGDLRTKPLRQIITAAADGANAVVSAEKFLQR